MFNLYHNVLIFKGQDEVTDGLVVRAGVSVT